MPIDIGRKILPLMAHKNHRSFCLFERMGTVFQSSRRELIREVENLGRMVTVATLVSKSFTALNNSFLYVINVLPRI